MSTGYKPITLGVPEELREAMDGSLMPMDINMVTILDRMRDLDESALQGMLDTIEFSGSINPIQVRQSRDANGKTVHYLIAGRRRLEAYRRKFAAALAMPEGSERDMALARWSRIPAVVYPYAMTEDLANYLEIIENLDRQDLTPGERKAWAAKKAQLVEKIRPRDGSKTNKGSKGSMWTPPAIKAAAETAGVPFQTFKKWYAAYKADHHGKDWNKQSRDEYQGFLIWMEEAGQREKKAEEEKAAQAAAKTRTEHVGVAAKVIAALLKEFGDLAVLEAIEAAGGAHLLGGRDGR
jgi:uncharacterized ParB-like nuclease family protein